VLRRRTLATFRRYYGPKHAPKRRLGEGVQHGPLDGRKDPQQLSPAAPSRLPDAFEACFLAMVMLCLGIQVQEAAVLSVSRSVP
jgi:hypothetical protein